MSTLARLLQLARPHWRAMALAAALGAITIGSGIALFSTSAYLISAAAIVPSIAELQVAIVGVRFFGISRGVFRYLERLASHSVTLNLLADIRAWFYAALEPLAPARVQQAHSGDLLTRAVSDVDELQEFFVRVLAPPLVALVVTTGFAVFLAYFAPVLALAALASLAFVGLAVPALARAAGRAPGAVLVAARARLTQAVVDGLQGLADLLANNAGSRHQACLAAQAAAVAGAEKRLAWVAGLHTLLTTLGVNAGGWLVLWLAIPMVAGGLFPGVNLAVVVLGTLAAFEAVLPFAQSAQALETQLPAARRIFALADAPQPVPEPRSPVALAASFHLSIRELAFAYEAGPPVLNRLSLDLPEGHKAAILGPSGAGKTTLFNLLLRFWDYDRGRIELGGVDLRRLPPERVRAQFAVVPQHVHIFNASLEENLRLAKPEAQFAELEEAARRANLLDFIEAQPEAWNTWAGEQGLRLSGGERQRLGVARALLREAPILLLDEFTTHLDPATAQAVVAETLAAASGRSVLVITHTLAGLTGLDAVYNLIDGQLHQDRGSSAT